MKSFLGHVTFLIFGIIFELHAHIEAEERIDTSSAFPELTCSSRPCRNGGECVNAIWWSPGISREYLCMCRPEFCGTRCETNQFERYTGYQLECFEEFQPIVSIKGSSKLLWESCRQACAVFHKCKLINYVIKRDGQSFCSLYEKPPSTCDIYRILK
ncbi:uncharacterized protein LOC111086063 [Limulus polyphemus]|uniref:Uncharacterized protein LOC111086063 n=1 Tax=Limulus polyphemus TaxID=6850 RepID=A0ABM1SHS3_LIMPO|nr:uncharacterized protein LOC111086063 [Limulus polyphemus]